MWVLRGGMERRTLTGQRDAAASPDQFGHQPEHRLEPLVLERVGVRGIELTGFLLGGPVGHRFLLGDLCLHLGDARLHLLLGPVARHADPGLASEHGGIDPTTGDAPVGLHPVQPVALCRVLIGGEYPPQVAEPLIRCGGTLGLRGDSRGVDALALRHLRHLRRGGPLRLPGSGVGAVRIVEGVLIVGGQVGIRGVVRGVGGSPVLLGSGTELALQLGVHRRVERLAVIRQVEGGRRVRLWSATELTHEPVEHALRHRGVNGRRGTPTAPATAHFRRHRHHRGFRVDSWAARG